MNLRIAIKIYRGHWGVPSHQFERVLSRIRKHPKDTRVARHRAEQKAELEEFKREFPHLQALIKSIVAEEP